MSVDLATIAASGATFRLFHEVRFAEPPATVPVLPRPGLYKHPEYGDIELTPERLANFVSGFKSRIYQQHIPIDAEHDTKLSGALGYLTDLVVNDDGSVDAAVEWTDRGSALVAADRYRYVSPEWYDRWTDPATETEFTDVLVGLALTTRPFFKDAALRPLVAREGALEVDAMSDPEPTKPQPENPPPAAEPPTPSAPAGDAPNPTEEPMENDEQEVKTPQAEAAPDPTVALTEQTVYEFGEMRKRLAASEKLLAETQAHLAAERKEKRLKTYTDEVRGRSDQNNTPWVGDIESHVQFCMDLAEKFGEDSAQLKHYITSNRAVAEQQKQSNLFREIGTSRSRDTISAYDRISVQASERAKSSGKTFEQEFEAVLNSDASLRAELARERRQERT